MTSENPADEICIQGTVMSEANDQSSSAIECEVWTNLGPSMSCAHLAGRHNLAAEAIALKAGAQSDQIPK
jgi:hypothetical protein